MAPPAISSEVPWKWNKGWMSCQRLESQKDCPLVYQILRLCPSPPLSCPFAHYRLQIHIISCMRKGLSYPIRTSCELNSKLSASQYYLNKLFMCHGKSSRREGEQEEATTSELENLVYSPLTVKFSGKRYIKVLRPACIFLLWPCRQLSHGNPKMCFVARKTILGDRYQYLHPQVSKRKLTVILTPESMFMRTMLYISLLFAKLQSHGENQRDSVDEYWPMNQGVTV